MICGACEVLLFERFVPLRASAVTGRNPQGNTGGGSGPAGRRGDKARTGRGTERIGVRASDGADATTGRLRCQDDHARGQKARTWRLPASQALQRLSSVECSSPNCFPGRGSNRGGGWDRNTSSRIGNARAPSLGMSAGADATLSAVHESGEEHDERGNERDQKQDGDHGEEEGPDGAADAIQTLLSDRGRNEKRGARRG